MSNLRQAGCHFVMPDGSGGGNSGERAQREHADAAHADGHSAHGGGEITPLDRLDGDTLVKTGDKRTVTVQELRDRVFVVEPGLVVMREIRTGSVRSCELMQTKFVALSKQFDKYANVLDLSEAEGKPEAGVREKILDAWSESRSEHHAVVLPPGIVARIVLRFIIARLNLAETSFHETYDQALARAQEALRLARAASS